MQQKLTIPQNVLIDAMNRSFPIEAIIEEFVSGGEEKKVVKDILSVWISRIAAAIRQGLDDVLERGTDALDNAKTTILVVLENARKEAGDRFPKIAAQVVEKMSAFEESLLQGALEHRARPRSLDGEVFRVVSFTVTESIILTTNLEVSLTRLLKFAAAGELSFTLQYETTRKEEAL